jgi:hypothetical protein
MNDVTKTAITALAPVVKDAIENVTARRGVVVSADAATQVTREVAAVVVNQANQEPWYQSRVTWGAIIAVAGGLAGIGGYSIGAEDQAQIVNGIVGVTTAVGGLLAWYGRWRARKPIGQ